jgi:hypothetical protein
MAMANAKRVVTDMDDVIVVTQWDDGTFEVEVFDHETGRALQLSLTKHDVEELSAAFHDHE